MRLYELTSPLPPEQQLMALSQLLSGRATDTDGPQEISVDAFIQLARNLGVQVNKNTLGEMIARPPLSNVLEPFEPNSGKIRFKGNTETTTDMSVDQAEDVVDANAKRAMKRGMK